ncbi:MAG TPA: hypothetical protein VGV15_07825, partial [Terriglobales bacterium]|nr:hypothetical protein [Terriglobales bacterium]
ETMTPMAANRRAQQRRYDQFRQQYNEERPHEALDMHTPASCYTPSPPQFPARVPEPQYPSSMIVRGVFRDGQFSWKHHDVFLSETSWENASAYKPSMIVGTRFTSQSFRWRSSTAEPARFIDCQLLRLVQRGSKGRGNRPLPLLPIPKIRTKVSTMCPVCFVNYVPGWTS